MERLKEGVVLFASITTGIVFSAAVFCSIFWNDADMGPEILWQILLVALICSLGKAILPARELSKKEMAFYALLYYLYVVITVFACGLGFGWFDPARVVMLVVMFCLITIIYAAVWIIMLARDKKTAEILNEKLEKYQRQKKI